MVPRSSRCDLTTSTSETSYKTNKDRERKGEGGVSTKRERKKERDDYHPREECGEDEKRGDSGAEGATWKG